MTTGTPPATATFFSLPRAKNPSDMPSGEEVRPVLPAHRAPVEQADVRLLHQIRWLPSDGLALAREHPARHLPKLALHERSELTQGLRVPAAPRLKQPGHIGDHCPGVYPVTAGCRHPFSSHPGRFEAGLHVRPLDSACRSKPP